MNKIFLLGILEENPRIMAGKDGKITVARYILQVEREVWEVGGKAYDYIDCVTFYREAAFAVDYLKERTKIAAVGHFKNGSYVNNNNGEKIWTTDVVIDKQEIVESKTVFDSDTLLNLPPEKQDLIFTPGYHEAKYKTPNSGEEDR